MHREPTFVAVESVDNSLTTIGWGLYFFAAKQQIDKRHINKTRIVLGISTPLYRFGLEYMLFSYIIFVVRCKCIRYITVPQTIFHPSNKPSGRPVISLCILMFKFPLIKYPQGDLNPCLMAENHVSWAWLDDGGVNYLNFIEIYSIEI